MRIEGGTFAALPKLRWLDLSGNSPFNSGERGSQVFKGLERKLSHLGLRNVSLIHVSNLFKNEMLKIQGSQSFQNIKILTEVII